MDEQKQKKTVEFKILHEGPIHASGEFTIIDASGKIIKIEGEAYFCACGISNNKPFCDCSHDFKLK